MQNLAEIYLENRSKFYAALLPRIPNPEIRQWLETAVSPYTPDRQTSACAADTALDLGGDAFASTLALMDWLKKSSYGSLAARTVISIHEALKRSREVEETGILLFDMLCQQSEGAAAFSDELKRRREALSAVIILEDGLRYHRLKMV
jgi:hypothetical protein